MRTLLWTLGVLAVFIAMRLAAAATFPVNDNDWRRWANIHITTRQGVGFGEMTDQQIAAVWELLAAGMSAKGVTLAPDITQARQQQLR